MGKIAKMEIGNVYGRLTVLVREGASSDGTLKYRCKCSCGNEHVVVGTQLRQGTTRSCGCLVHENKGKIRFENSEIPAFNQVVCSYRTQAKHRGLCWELSDDMCWTLFKAPCYYCDDIETNTVVKKRKHHPPCVFKYNGIDRCDSNLGYTASNVVSCCFIDNRAKREMSMFDYLAWLARLVDYRNRIS